LAVFSEFLHCIYCLSTGCSMS